MADPEGRSSVNAYPKVAKKTKILQLLSMHHVKSQFFINLTVAILANISREIFTAHLFGANGADRFTPVDRCYELADERP